MSKRDVLLFLFKWKYSLVGYFLFVAILATVFVYLTPLKYSTKAVLLIESNRSPVMRSDVSHGLDESIVLNSELAIIMSNTVLSNAVDSIGVQKKEPPSDSFSQFMADAKLFFIQIGLVEPITARYGVIRALSKDLAVEPVPGSTIINLSLSGENPKWITKMVNAVTDSYIDHHLKVFSSPGSTEFFQLKLNHLEKELQPLRQDLDSYKQKYNLSAVEDSIRALVRRRTELLLKQDNAMQEKAQLQTVYMEGHSKIRLVNEKIGDIQASLWRINGKLRALELHKEKTNDMRDEIASFEKSFLDSKRRYEEARMRDLANTEIVNVRIIEYASEPTRTDHSRIFYIVLAMVGGLMLSIVISLIKEYFDHRISDPNRIELILGIPVLGSIKMI